MKLENFSVIRYIKIVSSTGHWTHMRVGYINDLFLKIAKRENMQTTISDTDTEKKLEAIGWTPLHTRFIAHRIGDGSVTFRGHYDYSNKHINEFVELAKLLKIKCWGPIISDKYGTYKIGIHKKTFRDFASIFHVSHEELIRNPLILLDAITKLPQEHQIQAILAFIVDDGSCKNWRLTVFEDHKENNFIKVKSLWDNLFPNTSKIYIYITKNKTKIYHLFANREGILSLDLKIKKAVEKYGNLADLWWKQRDFDIRHQKATSLRAKQLNETKVNENHRNSIIFDYLREHKYITFNEAKRILNLSHDRTKLVFVKLMNNHKLFRTGGSYKSRYSMIRQQ